MTPRARFILWALVLLAGIAVWITAANVDRGFTGLDLLGAALTIVSIVGLSRLTSGDQPS